jgi:hypothetical protein
LFFNEPDLALYVNHWNSAERLDVFLGEPEYLSLPKCSTCPEISHQGIITK